MFINQNILNFDNHDFTMKFLLHGYLTTQIAAHHICQPNHWKAIAKTLPLVVMKMHNILNLNINLY